MLVKTHTEVVEMSEQKMDAERAAFEDWADSQWPGAKREQLKCDAYGEYLNSIYRDLWRGWQARASLPVGVPEGWLIENGFDVVDRPFRFVDSKSHTPTVKVVLPACEADDSASWDLRDNVAARISAMLAAPPAAPTVKAERMDVCDTCHGQGEIWVGEQTFGYMSMQPPEPIMDVCPECGGDPAPSLPAAGAAVEEVEVIDGAAVEDCEGGNHDDYGVGLFFTSNCIRRFVDADQHNRIVAALSAQQSAPERMIVPVESLERAVTQLERIGYRGVSYTRALRALLASHAEGGKV